jgi:hypothetical protein
VPQNLSFKKNIALEEMLPRFHLTSVTLQSRLPKARRMSDEPGITDYR